MARPPRRQFNIRLPDDLVDAIDARRAERGLSQSDYAERALRFALTFNPESQPGALRTRSGRTAPPPHRRPANP